MNTGPHFWKIMVVWVVGFLRNGTGQRQCDPSGESVGSVILRSVHQHVPINHRRVVDPRPAESLITGGP